MAANELVCNKLLDPCMSEVFTWKDLAEAHTIMMNNQHKPGNMSILVNALKKGMTSFEEVVNCQMKDYYL